MKRLKASPLGLKSCVLRGEITNWDVYTAEVTVRTPFGDLVFDVPASDVELDFELNYGDEVELEFK